jgi:hypothetical protein
MAAPPEPKTIAQAKEHLLARLLAKKGIRLPAPDAIGPRNPETRLLPLSFAQQRMWFLDQMEPGQSTYHIAMVARLEGPLRISALRRGLRTVIDRHESLRTAFTCVEGHLRQIVAATVDLPMSIVDISARPAADREALAGRLAVAEARRPFCLTRAPLLRLRLVRMAPSEHVLLLVTHHIVSDGWSLGVLVRELGKVYVAEAENRPAALPELPVQYPDYALWQRDRLRGDRLAEEIDWWRQELAGAPDLLELPTDSPRPAVQSFRGANLPFTWSAGLRDRLRALGGRHDATLFMVLLAGFAAVLSRYSRQRDVVVGTPVAGPARARGLDRPVREHAGAAGAV